jgi:tetratricopeptide (TPR) repeat protein
MRRSAEVGSAFLASILVGLFASSAAQFGQTGGAGALEAAANRCRTAQEALLAYQVFLSDPSVGSDSRQAAQMKLADWKHRAEQGSVRVGVKWMTESDAAQIRREWATLLNDGVTLLASGSDNAGALKKLEKASAADPDDIRPAFVRGLAWNVAGGGLGTDKYYERGFEEAKEAFDACKNKDPDNAAVLNNLAIIEVKLGLRGSAIQHWEKAVRLSDDQRIVQNVTRFQKLAQGKALALKGTEPRNLERLYQSLTAEGRIAPGTNAARTWQFMPIAAPAGLSPSPASESTISAVGSGVIVHPGYVLAHADAVSSATTIKVAGAATGRTPQSATLSATMKNGALVLLRCEAASGPALAFDTASPTTAATLVACAYGQTDSARRSPLTTRFSLAAPSSNLSGMVLYGTLARDAPMFGISSRGAPVTNLSGGIVAVQNATYSFGGKLSAGVPAQAALDFVKQSIPDYSPPAPPSSGKSVEQRLAEATMLVLAEQPVQPVGLENRLGSDLWEDPSCVACNHRTLVDCPKVGCVKGRLVRQVTIRIGSNPMTGADITETKPVRDVFCPVCDPLGSSMHPGLITCPRCKGTGLE